MIYDVCDNLLNNESAPQPDASDWVLPCGEDLELRVSFQQGVTVITFRGELSWQAVPAVAESLELVAEVGLARVLVDAVDLTVHRPDNLEGLVVLVERVRQARGVCAVVGLDGVHRRWIAEGWPERSADVEVFDSMETATTALLEPWPEKVAGRDALVAELAQLRRAMETRATIEQAKGILMAQRRCTADSAFEVLVQASRRTNTKLADLAANLVDHTAQPHHGRVLTPPDGRPPQDGRDGQTSVKRANPDPDVVQGA